MKDKKEKLEKLKDLVMKKEKEGKVVIATFDGLKEIDLDSLVNQPTAGLLYDLNRDTVTVLGFLDDPKWVNDYAVGLVIARLKNMLEEANNENRR